MFGRTLPVLILVFAVSIAQTEPLQGRIVAIADGDTVTLLDASKTQHKIRLAGIDAPEKKQPFGQRSKESLSDLVFNQEVQVETTKRDRYGREIGKVLADGVDVNLEQLRRGMAWHYKAYEREQSPRDRSTYSAAEKDARAARRGLWTYPAPLPPWEFRHHPRSGPIVD